MKAFFTVFGVLAAGVVGRTILHQGHEQRFDYKSPSEVFGPVNTTVKARAHSRRRSSRLASGNADYYGRRTPGDCSFPFNVLILQDSTGSFEQSFFSVMGQALQVLADEVFVDHPDSTFSIISYQDKPINQLGEESDSCFTVDLLGCKDSSVMLQHYSEILNGGGYDWPENQFGAILAALKSPQTIPWLDEELGTALIIHITDSAPHFDGDNDQHLYPQLTKYPGTYNENNAEDFCNRYYYPDPWTVADAVLSKGAYVSTLIFNSELYGDLALDSWNWWNTLVDQDPGFVTAADDDSLTWLAHFVEVINNIRGDECGPLGSSTTTPTATTPAVPTTEESTQRPLPTDTAPTSTTEVTQLPETTSTPPTTEVPTTDTPTYPSGEGTETPQGTITTTTSTGPTGGSPTTSSVCECPSEDPCCRAQPEFLLAILRRPSELDIHMKE